MVSAPVSIALVGPGAIGGAVAGALLAGGHHPILCARTGGFERLRVEHGGGVIDEPVQVVTSPEGLDHVDVVFLAVKAHQSEAARGWLDALVGPATTVVILQNGVEHRERIEPMAPGADLVPAVINLPAKRPAPDHVIVGGRSLLTFAAGPGAEAAAALFDGTFMKVKVVDDWATPSWIKLMLNAASGGVSTLTRTDNRMLGDPVAERLVLEVMEEVAAVGRAEGAELPEDLPPRIIEGLRAAASGHVASIVADRLAGVPTEWDARNAVVGRIGRRHGIATPLNDLLTTLIQLGEPGAAGLVEPSAD